MEVRSSVGILFDLRELPMADDLGRDSAYCHETDVLKDGAHSTGLGKGDADRSYSVKRSECEPMRRRYGLGAIRFLRPGISGASPGLVRLPIPFPDSSQWLIALPCS